MILELLWKIKEKQISKPQNWIMIIKCENQNIMMKSENWISKIANWRWKYKLKV